MTVSVYGNIPENKQNENEQAVKEPVQEEKMGILGWMNPEDYSFDCMLRMERFQIRYILGNPDEAGKKALAMALKANPKVAGLFMSKCPEMAETVKTLTAQVPAELTPEEKQMVEVRGNAKKVLIYHMTKHEIGDFDVYSMYYVGPDADEWAEEREELMKVRMGSNTCQAKALVEIPQFNVVTAYSTEVWPVNGGLMRMA